MGTREELRLAENDVVALVDRQISGMGGVTSVPLYDNRAASAAVRETIGAVQRVEASVIRIISPGQGEQALQAEILASTLEHHPRGKIVEIYPGNPNYFRLAAEGRTRLQIGRLGTDIVTQGRGLQTSGVNVLVNGRRQPDAYKRHGRS